MLWCGWFRVQGSGFRVQGSGFRVQGSGFRVQGAGFRVPGSGFRVQGSGFEIMVWRWWGIPNLAMAQTPPWSRRVVFKPYQIKRRQKIFVYYSTFGDIRLWVGPIYLPT